MNTNPVSLIDSALNAAEMGAFCYPEGGPVIAAGLTGIQAVVDILFGGEDQKAAGDRFVTKSDLNDAIDDVRKAISDTQLKKDLDDNTTDICTLQGSFDTTMQAVLAGKGFASGTRWVDIANDASWQTYYAAQQKPIYDSDSSLKKIITGLTRKTDKKTQYQTAILFSSAVGMFMNYCQLLMLIEYSKDQNIYQDALDAYDTAKAAYDAAVKKGKHHGKGLPPAPVPPPDLPDSYLQLVSLPSSDTLDDKLKEAIAYLEPLVVDLEAMYAALDSEPQARMDQVAVQPVQGGYAYIDAATGFQSFTYGSQMQADMALQIYQDQLLGQAEQAVRARYPEMWDGDDAMVAEDDTKKLRQIVDDWKACRAGYAKLLAPNQSAT